MIHVILLAAGKGSRFGENKLLFPVFGKPMYRHAVDLYVQWAEKRSEAVEIVLVTAYHEILRDLKEMNLRVVENTEQERGISHSIRLGISGCKKIEKEDVLLFSVCDQPWLNMETINGLVDGYMASGKNTGCVGFQNRLCNPALFSASYEEELKKLTGDTGGKQIIKQHQDQLYVYQVNDEKIVTDIDVPERIKDEFISDYFGR